MRMTSKSYVPVPDWLEQLKGLLSLERQTLVAFLLLLGKIDAEKSYLELGYASAWDFVRRGLGQSEKMTFYRLTTARVLARFPQAVELLREGKLCMTTLATLARHLTEANCTEILAEAMGKTKREILSLKARLDPKPVPKDLVHHPLAPGQVEVPTTPGPCPRLALNPPRQEVLTETLTRRHMTTDAEFENLLRSARSALSHKMPGASDLDLLKEGLREIVRKEEKRKALVAKPRAPKPRQRPARGGEAIPAEIRREVWLRDGGACQWPTADGSVCGSTVRVQYHH